jgi:hypothetical protein
MRSSSMRVVSLYLAQSSAVRFPLFFFLLSILVLQKHTDASDVGTDVAEQSHDSGDVAVGNRLDS